MHVCVCGRVCGCVDMFVGVAVVVVCVGGHVCGCVCVCSCVVVWTCLWVWLCLNPTHTICDFRVSSSIDS